MRLIISALLIEVCNVFKPEISAGRIHTLYYCTFHNLQLATHQSHHESVWDLLQDALTEHWYIYHSRYGLILTVNLPEFYTRDWIQ